MYTSWFWAIVTKWCNYNDIPDFPSDNFDVTESPSTKTCSFPTCWPTYFTWCTCRSFILRKTSFYTTRWVYAFFGQRYSLFGTEWLHVTKQNVHWTVWAVILSFQHVSNIQMYIEGVVLLIFPRGEGPFFQKWMRSTFCDFTTCFSASEIHMVGDGDRTLWPPPPPPRDSITKINLSMIRVNNRQQIKKIWYIFLNIMMCVQSIWCITLR